MINDWVTAVKEAFMTLFLYIYIPFRQSAVGVDVVSWLPGWIFLMKEK